MPQKMISCKLLINMGREALIFAEMSSFFREIAFPASDHAMHFCLYLFA